MPKCSAPLNNIKIAAPCPADWDGMVGNDRVRFCGQCSLNVYNLSSMSRKEAEDLIQSTEGRLCIRFYQRKDGTVLTDNCPVGLRAIKRRVNRIASAAISAVLSFAAGFGLSTALTKKEVPHVMGEMVTRQAVMGHAVNPQIKTPEPQIDPDTLVMGAINIERVRQPSRVRHSPKRTGKH